MDFGDLDPALLAGLIFLMRIADVSLGTVRAILVMRSYAALAGLIGFFEVLLWIAAAGSVLGNLDRWYLAVAYAAGFGTGNVIGIWLEAKLAMGNELVRAISTNVHVRLAERLRARGYSVVRLEGTGAQALPVEVVFVVERRRNVPALIQVIEDADPEAVCSLSDVRSPRRESSLWPKRRLSFSERLTTGKRK